MDQAPMTLECLRSRYSFRQTAVNVGIGSQVVIGADSRRVGIIFAHVGGAAAIYVAPEGQVQAGYGIFVGQAGIGMLELWTPRHGILPSVEWWGDSPAGGASMLVIEVLYQ